MFGSVFCNKTLCKELLERILDISINEIEVIDREKTIQNTLYTKGSRLDIYVKDSNGNYYSIEMQTVNTNDLNLRSRYYHSQMDNYHLKKGEKGYSNFPNSVVIFICTFDYFGKGRSIYRFDNICVDDHTILLDERRTTIFINIWGDRNEINEDTSSLLDYFKTGKPTDCFTSLIQADVEAKRDDDEWRESYMTIDMLIETRSKIAEEEGFERGMKRGMEQGMEQGIQQGIQKGIQQGIQQGIQKGIEEGIEKGINKSKADLIEKLLRSGKTIDQIADFCGFNVSEIETIDKRISSNQD